MGDLVQLHRPLKTIEPDPHLIGPAKCLACSHEWLAVSPMPCRAMLECPGCHCLRGVFKNEVIREGDRWECWCGNFYFILTSRGTYCPNCAEWQIFPAGPSRAS